ncbi:MAG: CBS domain-containing protein [Proteobacteria bacterium]|jgi:CBS domain-containing protein|nr:CBS domain-containing protein [Pseudomonadota bacterium]MDA1301112.1 CBS domain-containing protein [Pseudomonadota bacterium]
MPGVQEFIVREPVSVSADMDVYAAAHVILSHRVSGVVVVDEDGKLVGMLSELDCLRALVHGVYNGSDPGIERVGELMTRNVAVNHSDDDILDVATSMLERKHRRRPVVDENGRLTGQITCRQILKAVTDFKESANSEPDENT